MENKYEYEYVDPKEDMERFMETVYDGITEEVNGRFLKDGRIPVAHCCEANKRFGVVFLVFESEVEYGNEVADSKPKWKVVSTTSEGHSSVFVDVKFCPLCGKELPDVVKTKELKIRRIVDGGYYCDTCDERLHGCECDNPALEWEEVYPGCLTCAKCGKKTVVKWYAHFRDKEGLHGGAPAEWICKGCFGDGEDDEVLSVKGEA